MPLQSSDLPSDMARLETLLGDTGEEGMTLSELDGFLCALLVAPLPIEAEEWWPLPWLADGRGELRPGLAELAGLVGARFAEMEHELAEGRYAPLYEVDDETGEIVWQLWLAGFEQAMQLRFEAWDELLRHPFQDVRGEAATRLATALLMAQPDFGPDDTASDQDWADYDSALSKIPEDLAIAAMLLYQSHLRD